MNKAVDERWQKFEDAGEQIVRQNLAANTYNERNKALARAWLDHKAALGAHEAGLRSEDSSREQIRIARSAKNAAWAAAIAAIIAAICAIISILLST